MRKLLALTFLALSVANANAQYLNVSPSGGGGTPGGSDLQIQYNNAGAFGGMAGTSWNDTTRSLTITGTGSGTGSTLSIISGAAAPQFTVLDNGNVGIGEATPTTALYVNPGSSTLGGITLKGSGTSGTSVFISPSSTGGIAYGLFSTADGSAIGGGKFTIYDSVAFTHRLVVTNTGNVGIGATSPSVLLTLASAGVFGWDNGAGTADLLVGRFGAASLRLGAAAAASPVAQTLRVQGASGTDTAAAAALTIIGPLATGNAAPGDIVLQTGAVGASGATASTATTALTIKGTTQDVTFAKSATFAEMTAPSAPAANGATLYCDDNGAGKTRCSILFATGAAQQIAIEP